MSFKAACITFPGSNCDQDIHRAVGLMGWNLVKVWHEDRLTEKVDVIFVPGGFSYGDYLRCGALAKYSTAMKSVHEHAARGGFVVGICNGFQILCEAGLLPGALVRNRGLKFRCIWTHLRIAAVGTALTAGLAPGQVLRVPIAHGEGNYVIDRDGLQSLREHDQIVFEYCDEVGNATDAANPNGATANIAGICNAEGNVFGMMPHPERAMEAELGGTDGRHLFNGLAGAMKLIGAGR